MSNLFKKVTSTVSVVAIVASAMSSTLVANAASSFAPYADALATAGIIAKQTTEAGYNLGNNVTRAEMAKIAVNLKKAEVKECTSKVFSDVTSTLGDLCGYVEAAANAGLVNKTYNKFRPMDLVTRAEMIKMLLGALNIAPVTETQGFVDLGTDASLNGYINAAAKAGIINKGTSFNPNNNASRGEAFKVAANAAGLTTTSSVEEGDDLNLGDLFGDITGGTSTGTTSTGTTSTGTTTVTAAGDLEVALNPATPAAANVPYGSASVKLVSFDLTAGSSDAALNTLSVKRLGVGASTDIASVYLYSGDKRISNAITINSYDDVANFTNLNMVVKAGSTLTLTVRGDMKASTGTLPTRSNQIAVIAVNGTAPKTSIVGNLVTLLDVGTAAVDFAYQTIASTTANVGSTGVEVGKIKVSAPSTQEVDIKSITLTNSATSVINANNVVNLKLLASDGTVVASASGLTTVRGDDIVTFAFATPIRLGKGNNKVFSITADLIGGRSGDNVQFTLANATDLEAIGLTYGFGLGITTITTAASTVSLKAGKLTLAFNGPSTKDVSKGTNDVELGTYVITTGGSAIEIKGLSVDLVKTTAFTIGAAATALTNIRVVDENGVTVLSDSTNITGGDLVTQTLTFGDQVMTLGANTSKTFKVIANVPTTTTAGVFFVRLTAPSTWSYVKDLVLNKKLAAGTSDFSEVVPNTSLAANPVTVVSGGLTLNFGTDVSAKTVVRGAALLPVATLNFAANRGSDVYVRNVQLLLTSTNLVGAATPKDIVSSVGLYNGTTLVGTLKSVTGVGGNEVTLDNLNYKVPAGTTSSLTVKVDLTKNGDVFAAAAPLSTVKASVSSVTAEDSNFNTIIPTIAGVVAGNAPVITVKKSGSITANIDGSTRSKSILSYGSKDNSVYSYRFDIVDEAFQIKDLAFVVAGNTTVVSTLKLYKDGVAVQTNGAADAVASIDATTGKAAFSNLNLVIDKASVLTVKADLVNLSTSVTTGTPFTVAIDTAAGTINKANGLSSGQEVDLTTTTFTTNAVVASNSMVPKATSITVAPQTITAAGGGANKDIARFTITNSVNASNSDVELTQWAVTVDDANFTTKATNFKMYKSGNASVTVAGTRVGNVVTFNLATFADRFVAPGSTDFIISADVTPDALSTTTENLQISFGTATAGTDGVSWMDGRDDTKYTRGAADTYIDMGSASATISSTRLSY